MPALGLGIRPLGPSARPSFAALGIMSGRGDEQVKVEHAAGDVLDEILGAREVGARGSFAAAMASPWHSTATRTVLPVPFGSATVARSCWSLYLGSMFSRTCASADSTNFAVALSIMSLMPASGATCGRQAPGNGRSATPCGSAWTCFASFERTCRPCAWRAVSSAGGWRGGGGRTSGGRSRDRSIFRVEGFGARAPRAEEGIREKSRDVVADGERGATTHHGGNPIGVVILVLRGRGLELREVQTRGADAETLPAACDSRRGSVGRGQRQTR